MIEIHHGQNKIWPVRGGITTFALRETVSEITGLSDTDFYLIYNGKLVQNDAILDKCKVSVVPRTVGGKGGFGSMLRAIGAQIEKTTNREACRDLSGRRLRDINEEKRLKTWINQQVEREKEAAERKKKKLEKLCEKPRHEFKDESYDKARSDLTEKVEDAVLQGLQASTSSCHTGEKRKGTDEDVIKKKKPKLWIDAELGDLSSSSNEDSEDETSITEKTNSSDSNQSQSKSLEINM